MKSKRWIIALILGLCACLVASVVTYTRLLEKVDLSLAEIYASYSGKAKANDQIVLIPVEDNRLNLSLLMRALSRRPPRLTILNYDLNTSDENTGMFDIRLAEAMDYAGNVIVPLTPTLESHGQTNTNSFPSFLPHFVNVTGALHDLPEIKIEKAPASIFIKCATYSIGPLNNENGLRVNLIYNCQNRVVPSIELEALIIHDRIFERLVRIQSGSQIDWIALEKTRKINIDMHGGFYLKRFPQDVEFNTVMYDELMTEYTASGESGLETPKLNALMEKIVIVFNPQGVSRDSALKMGAVISSIMNMDYLIEKRGWGIYLLGFVTSVGLAFALLYFPLELHSIPIFCLLFLIGIGYFLFRLGYYIPISGILAGCTSIYLSCIMLRKDIISGKIDELF